MSTSYQCPVCAQEFKSELSWRSHYDKKHNYANWLETFLLILQKLEIKENDSSKKSLLTSARSTASLLQQQPVNSNDRQIEKKLEARKDMKKQRDDRKAPKQ